MTQIDPYALVNDLSRTERARLAAHARRLARRIAAREFPRLVASRTQEEAREIVAEGWCGPHVDEVDASLRRHGEGIVARRAQQGRKDDASLATHAAVAGAHWFWLAYDREMLRHVDAMPGPAPPRQFGSLSEALGRRRSTR